MISAACVIGIKGKKILLLLGIASLKPTKQHSTKESDRRSGSSNTRACQFLKPSKEELTKERKALYVATFSSLNLMPNISVKRDAGGRLDSPALQEFRELVRALG
jgi:hypothetical protein